ncbi:derriere protein-like [Lineus longissimus]|uniref:derriere protein-like n=1 Tax=Lineus longissimus TaxID=88925 RepID=UPI002B4D7EEF
MKHLHAISDAHDDHCTLHHDIRGNIFRSIRNKGHVSTEDNEKNVIRLRFSTSAITPVEIATQAEVKVRIDVPRGIPEFDNINTLQLSLCHRGIGEGDGAGGCDVAEARSIGVGTFSADFKVADDILETVSGTSEEDVKFVIRLISGKEEVSDVCLSKVKVEGHLLLATYDSASCMTSSRQKRSMRGQYEIYKYPKICHMRPYKIDFRTIGWSDWVLAPVRYEANRCYGECPFPITEYLNGTNHAILQTLFHSHDDDIAPETCCVPVDYKSISILYIDHEENVVLRKYKDMVVTSCGCR